MSSNMPMILSTALCKLHHHKNSIPPHHNSPSTETIRRLSIIARHDYEQNISDSMRPQIDEIVRIIENSADLERPHTGRIKLNGYTLYYTVHESTHGNTVYFCLMEHNHPQALNDIQHAHNTAIATQFLEILEHAVSRDSELVHAISLPNLHQNPHAKIQPNFINIVMDAHQTIQNNFGNGNDAASSSNPHSTQIAQLQQQVEDVKAVMSDNVIRIMEREERLEDLNSRTDALHASSQNFKTTARRMQRNMCVKNLKWTIILGSFILIVVIFIIYMVLHDLNIL